MIRMSSNFFKKILDTLPSSVYFKDKNGRYVWLNQSSVRLLSSRHQITSSIIGKTDFDVFPSQHAAEYVKNDKIVMDGRVGLVVEEDVLLPTGQNLIQLSFREPFIDEKTDQVLGVVGYTIDISDRKRTEVVEAKEQFLRNMRHDIRTPFSGILGIADHLRRNEPDSSDRKKMLVAMKKSHTHGFQSPEQARETVGFSDAPLIQQPLSPRILFVEDSVMVKLGCVPMLESLNATVDAVDSGEEALEHIKLQHYDMVFMDIGLPGIDGYETTRRIRAMKKGKKIPIIAVTAHSMGDVSLQANAVGMNDAIQKPLTPEDALRFFNTYLYDKGYLINEDIIPTKQEDPHKHIFDLAKSLVKLGTETAVNNYLCSLTLYLSDSLSLLTTLFERKDRISFAKEVHKLKGGVSLIEAPDLYQSILRLSDGLKIGQTGDIPALFNAVLDAADVFKQYIVPRVIKK